ncbi:MAG TPA: ATP-dependent helicase, partial [Bacteroidota bacterium]|nr:ATP-dependent helicase [Bacteroidota bacterium]
MFSINELNSQQRDAVQAPNGPTMVLGGPGCGKTRVLAHRIAHLLQLGVCTSQIMAVLRTNKTADEMKNNVFHLVGEKNKNLCIGTFHTIFARVLRKNAEAVGYRSNFSLYDTVDSINLIKSIMKSLGISIQQFAPQEILSRISSMKNQVIAAEEYFDHTSDLYAQCTTQIFDEYQKRLKQCNAMDLDDLVLKSIEMFANAKNILTWHQDRIRFFLIDDFQDISRSQYTLSRFLAG